MSTVSRTTRARSGRISRRIGWLAPLAAGAALAAAATASAAPQAHVEAGAFDPDILTSSVFGAQSFRLRNDGDEPIVKMTVDLGDTALFPDIVFDPDTGDAAGDSAQKSFFVDIYEDLMDPGDPDDNVEYALALRPSGSNSGANGNGFNVLDVEFPDGSPMPPQSELKFSIDIDPTSVEGTNAGTDPTTGGSAYPAGAISGAELHGAKITVEYANGDIQTADLSRTDDITSKTDLLPLAVATVPTVALASGVAAPVATPNAVQNLTVTGPAGQAGIVLVAEGNLYLGDGLPGVDIEPFEANTAVKYTEFPFTFGADGTATVEVTLTNTSVTDLNADLFAPATTGLNYITVWANGPVSDPLVVQLDPNAPAPVPPGTTPPPNPGTGLPVGPDGLIAVPAGPLGIANCKPVPAASPSNSSGGTIRLSAGQLQTNQRIGQAAIRRLNAVQKWLDDGIVSDDLCGGTIGPVTLGGGLAQARGAAPLPSKADPRPLAIAKAGGSGTITLTPGQLRINQRIYRAALLRSRALEKRLSGSLTGGDIVDGTLDVGRFAVPLTRSATTAAPPAASVTDAVSLTDKGATIRLSAGQLRINQRIAQQAVREANDLRAILQRGLTGANFADGSVTVGDVAAS